jgi:hypothetical protein
MWSGARVADRRSVLFDEGIRKIFALVITAGDSFPEQIGVGLSSNVDILGGVEILRITHL